MQEHCPVCGRFMSGHYPIWACKRHGTFHAMLVPLEPRHPAREVMPGQVELEI